MSQLKLFSSKVNLCFECMVISCNNNLSAIRLKIALLLKRLELCQINGIEIVTIVRRQLHLVIWLNHNLDCVEI